MGIIKRLLGLDAADDSDARGDEAVTLAIERTVDRIDPRLRMVSGYQRKLRPGVGTALRFASEFAARVPGPVEVNSTAWRADPLLRLLFATPEDISRTFSRSQELQAFFAGPAGLSASHAYTMLAAHRTERKVLGMELQGEIIRADVAQLTVDFSNHLVVMPAADEAGVREELRRRALNYLLDQVLERLSGIRSRKKGLEQQRAILETRLRLLRQQGGSMDNVFEETPAGEVELKSVGERLEDNGRELEKIKASIGTLDHALQHIHKVAANPGELLRLVDLELCVDCMNRVIEGEADQQANTFRLLELSLEGNPPRSGVILIARFPRDELQSRQDLLRDAERYL
jgi:hypothetical protein